jgi:hypothetical protein
MIGQTLGQTFLTPDRNLIGGGQQQQAQVGRQQQPADMVGQPLMDLDPVAMDGDLNLTQQYYSQAAALKQFQQSMLVSAGIDVTAPDLSNAASIQASDAFMQGLGELQTLGNMLKESQKVRTADLASQRSGTIREIPNADPSLQTQLRTGENYEQMYYPTATDPEGDQMRQLGMGTYYDEKQVKEINDRYIIPYRQQQQAIINDPFATPMAKAKANENYNRVPEAQKSKREFAPQAPKSEPKKTVQEQRQERNELTALNEYKRGVGIALGDSAPDEIIVDDDFREIAIYNTFQGRSLGKKSTKLKGASGKFDVPFIIDYWYKAPDGKTYVRYVQPSILKQNGKLDKLAPSESDGQLLIPDTEIKNVGQMIEMMALNNEFDYSKDDFISALDKANLVGSDYRADDKKALTYDPLTGEEKEAKTSKLVLNDYREKVKAFAEDVKNMDKTRDGSRKMIKLPNGDILKIERGVFGYYNAWLNDVKITEKNSTSSDELVNIIFDKTDYFKGNKQQGELD